MWGQCRNIAMASRILHDGFSFHAGFYTEMGRSWSGLRWCFSILLIQETKAEVYGAGPLYRRCSVGCRV